MGYTLVGATSSYPVVASSTCATLSPTASSTVPYGDWLFVNVLLLFCVAWIPVGAFFSLLTGRRRKL